MKLDKEQKRLLSSLNLLNIDRNNSIFLKLFNRFNNRKLGIYVCGTVGCGKTMVCKAFVYRQKFALTIHYQELQYELQKKIHEYKQKKIPQREAIKYIASEYARNYKIIFIDELEILDLPTGLILENLLTLLWKQNVVTIITSNTHPENLYKDGLQRELLIPFFVKLADILEVFVMESQVDYRKQNKDVKQTIFYPINEDNKKTIYEIAKQLTNDKKYYTNELTIFERKVTFQKTYKKLLFSNFSEVCIAHLSFKDYNQICKFFSVIIIEDIPILNNENNQELIRLINLIDNAYFNKILFIASLQVEQDNLYQGSLKNLWDRAISRLYEMNSKNYIAETKKLD